MLGRSRPFSIFGTPCASCMARPLPRSTCCLFSVLPSTLFCSEFYTETAAHLGSLSERLSQVPTYQITSSSYQRQDIPYLSASSRTLFLIFRNCRCFNACCHPPRLDPPSQNIPLFNQAASSAPLLRVTNLSALSTSSHWVFRHIAFDSRLLINLLIATNHGDRST